MKFRIFFLLILGLGVAEGAGAAQNAFFGWYGLSAQGSFQTLSPALKKFSWSVLNQARLSHLAQEQYGGRANNLTENLLFVQFNYHFDRHFHAGLGYTRNWLDRFNENRAYQELGWRSLSHEWGRMTARTRLEERVNDKLHSNNMGVRLRQFFQWSHPLPGFPGLNFLLNDEVFWYLNSSSWRSDGFTENRVFAGLDIPLIAKTRLTVGYMNQFVRKGTSKDNLVDHILFTNIGFHF